MSRKRLLVGCAIIVLGVLVGSIILVYSSAYAKKNEVLLDASFKIEGGNQKFRSFFVSAPVKEVIVSFSVSNGIIKFSPWQAAIFEDSLGYFEYYCNGIEVQMVQPWFFEGTHGNAGLGMGPEGENQVWYLLFYNPDSYEKEVYVRVIKVWYETNLPAWIAGVAVMTIGTGVGLHADKFRKSESTLRSRSATEISKKLLASYSILTFIMTSLMAYPLFWTFLMVSRWLTYDPWEKLIFHLISPIPILLIMEALPLGIFIYLLLKKGGGLANLESWKMGKWSRAPASLLLSGYLIALIPAPINFLVMNGNFLYMAGSNLTVYNPLYFYSIYIGSAMMLCGIVALVCFWMIYVWRKQKVTVS